MTSDDLETLIRRMLAVGMSMLVVFAPATGHATTSDPPTTTVQPKAARPETAAPDKKNTDAGAATSAAVLHHWGTPTHVDEFTGGLGDDWQVYDGPGHDGKGVRSPAAVSVQNGIMTITGDAKGTTAGMALDTGQKYGRWEGRVRAPEASDSYHAVMLLWPDAENWPVGGEVDFMEMSDGQRATTDAFLHFGKDNSQVHDDVQTDATAWHDWAVEWTPQAVTAYLDGKQWFRSTDPKTLPPGPMHLCIQLDWFPGDGATRTSKMQVDWVKQYAVDDEGGHGTDEHNTGSTTTALTAPTTGGWRWQQRAGAATSGSTGSPSGTEPDRATITAADRTGPGR
jgi:beta-glucanase (GH16 family)